MTLAVTDNMGSWFGSHFGEDPTMMGAEEHPFLTRGTRSHDVGTWQALLGDVKVDDIFGPKTEASTKRFQAHHGLKADGKVGPLTWSAAYSAATYQPDAAGPSPSKSGGAVKLKSAGSLLRQAEAVLRHEAETVSTHKKEWGMPAVLALSALGIGALYIGFGAMKKSPKSERLNAYQRAAAANAYRREAQEARRESWKESRGQKTTMVGSADLI